MIVRRSPTLVALSRWYLRRRAARALDGVWVGGLHHAREVLAAGPAVMAANHVGWWDGPCMILVDEALGAEGAFVLKASSLVRYPYFRWIGAIPLPSSAMAMRSAFRAAASHLSRPGRTVWFFPQGRERPSSVRPLGLGRGHEVLARSAPLLPVAIAYAWRGGPLPAACIQIGAPVAPADLEPAIVAGLASIERFFDEGVGDFVPVVPRA